MYQEKIKKDPNYANEFLYPTLIPFMYKLIVDSFGNYLYQEFLGVLNKENFYHLINFIYINFYSIAFSTYGTRVIQAIIEKANIEVDILHKVYTDFSKRIQTNVYNMSTHENANHIIQRFLCSFHSNDLDFIYQEIYSSFIAIADNKFGCCVVQRSLVKANENQKECLFYLIKKNANFLIRSQFGNYVCQKLILINDDMATYNFYLLILKDFFKYCDEKYSSNVIEKFFEINNRSLIEEIVNNILVNENKVIDLVCSMYGNYILQKIFESVVCDNLKNKLIGIICRGINKIPKNDFSKKFLVKLSKKYTSIRSLI